MIHWVLPAVVFLAAGWYLYLNWRYTRYEALHHPGHPQYFGAALCAVYLFVLSAALHAIGSESEPYVLLVSELVKLAPIELPIDQSKNFSSHLAITAWAVVLGVLLPPFFNSPLSGAGDLGQIVAYRKGALDALEMLANKCVRDGTLCALTMKNGKVYIGLLDAFSGPRDGKDWLAMTPIVSGFRNSEGSLCLQTFYDIPLPEETPRNVFRVVLSGKDVLIAQSFDLVLYREFTRPHIELPGGVSEVRREQANEESMSHLPWAEFRSRLYLGLPILTFVAPLVGIFSLIAAWCCLLAAALCAQFAGADRLYRKLKTRG